MQKFKTSLSGLIGYCNDPPSEGVVSLALSAGYDLLTKIREAVRLRLLFWRGESKYEPAGGYDAAEETHRVRLKANSCYTAAIDDSATSQPTGLLRTAVPRQ